MSERSGKRAVLVAPHQDIEIWQRPAASPGPGEVLARLELGGVCGTDVHLWHGEVPLPGPIVLGHEGIGVVQELGAGVGSDFAGAPLAPGDRIYWQPTRPCHRCHGCTVLNDVTLCENYFAGVFGSAEGPTAATYSEYVTLAADLPFYRIPDDTPSEPIIAFGCAMPTMLQALERLGGIEPGQSVVVQGCGPVGLAATLLAGVAGAGEIVVVGAPAQRLELARQYGATHTLDLGEVADPAQRIAQVRELTGGRGAEVVIEAAGVIGAFSEGLEMTAANGRYLIVGLWSAPGTVPLEPRLINNRNLRIIGTALSQPRHLHQAIEVARVHHRRLPMAQAITHRFSIDQSQQALEAVARMETVKAVITPAA